MSDVRGLRRWYGGHPLHLLAMLASFALAGYAGIQLLGHRWLAVTIWFVGAAIGHDLLLLPLYAVADAGLLRLGRGDRRLAAAPWLSYVRPPAVISGVLFLVFAPEILRLNHLYGRDSRLSSAHFLGDWFLITGALFFGSALLCAYRLRRRARRE